MGRGTNILHTTNAAEKKYEEMGLCEILLLDFFSFLRSKLSPFSFCIQFGQENRTIMERTRTYYSD